MILVDTSIWIAVFRRQHPLDLAAVVPIDDVVTCLPVMQEVLQGFRDDRAWRVARDAMFNMTVLENPIAGSLREEAGPLCRAALGQGVTIRSSADCLIAACALRHAAEVLHRDRDFTSLARVSALRARTA